MSPRRTAKLFRNGASQAVRLPAEFRFSGTEVYVRRDEQTGDVILSQGPGISNWTEFLEFMQDVEVPDDYMADRPLNVISEPRRLFDDE